MATLEELHSQIDRGMKAVLHTKIAEGEEAEEVKIYISKDAQGGYTHTPFYPNRPSSFPYQRAKHYSTWSHLMQDIEGFQTASNQWNIE